MTPTDHAPRTTEADADPDPDEGGLGMAHLTVVPANFDPESRRGGD